MRKSAVDEKITIKIAHLNSEELNPLKSHSMPKSVLIKVVDFVTYLDYDFFKNVNCYLFSLSYSFCDLIIRKNLLGLKK